MKTRQARQLLGMISLVFIVSCMISGRDPDSPMSKLRKQIQRDFPVDLLPPSFPEDNPQSADKVVLGEALFFDPNLSSCGTVACASCHIPELAFSDGKRISKGCGDATGRRNSNALYNSAYLSHLFWDGRAGSLEEQALAPVVDPAEMSNTMDNVLHYLSTGEHPVTKQRFTRSALFYKGLFDRVFSGEVTSANVARALAAYERTLISRDSTFDRWLDGDDMALSPAQQRGALVFFGRGKCSECHSPPNFTDSEFHNVGVPLARFEQPGMFPENDKICGGIAANADPGRAEVASIESACSELGKFRTPTLRNVEFSSPYMHNGRFFSLEDVLQHYWSVGRGTTTPIVGVLDKEVQFVMLTDFGGHPTDIADLTAFLKALTGTQVKGPARGIAPPENLD